MNRNLAISCLVAFLRACLLSSLGFQPNDLSLLMSRSMFLTSPFQPLPPSTPPVYVNFTFFRPISSVTIWDIVLTSIGSSEPTLYISTWFLAIYRRFLLGECSF